VLVVGESKLELLAMGFDMKLIPSHPVATHPQPQSRALLSMQCSTVLWR